MEKRIEYIDLAKGFCIIFVVLFHIQGFYQITYPTDSVLSAVRMPLYYFLSGYFLKTYDGFFSFLKKKINKLLIPFLFFYLLTAVILPNLFHFAFNSEINTVYGWASLYAFIYPELFPNYAIWFLWSLFLANILFYLSVMLCKKKVWLILLSILLGVVGYFCWYHGINLPAFIDNTLFYFPFFLSGYLFFQHQLLENVVLNKYVWLLCVLSFLFLFFLFDKRYLFFPVSLFINYFGSLIGVLCILLISKRIHRLPVISYVGRYSIMVLLTHIYLIRILGTFIQSFVANTHVCLLFTLVITVLSYLLIIPLMRRYLPYVTAQKDLL